MAFSVAQMYPGAFTADVNFVDGKYKNSSAPGVYDGTPLDNLLFNQNLALFDALMLEANLTYSNSADIPSTSQLHKAMQIGREVSPRNNDWNGYLDPAHTVPIQKSNTSAGARSFPADTEIAPNLYVSAATNVTFSTTGISWLSGNTLYKLYDYTAEQLALIDVTKVPIYLKDQAGVEYFLKHNGTSVIVTKVGSQLKVEITAAIFSGSFTKLWRFFVTEKVGRVVEKAVDDTIKSLGLLTPIIVNTLGWGGGTVLSWDSSMALSKYSMLIAVGSASFDTSPNNARIVTSTFLPEELLGIGGIVTEYTTSIGTQVEVTLESVNETSLTVGVNGTNFGNLRGLYGVLR